MLHDPTFKVHIVNNEKPSMDLTKRQSSKALVQKKVSNLKFADEQNIF